VVKIQLLFLILLCRITSEKIAGLNETCRPKRHVKDKNNNKNHETEVTSPVHHTLQRSYGLLKMKLKTEYLGKSKCID
jgi:hypothetical protein